MPNIVIFIKLQFFIRYKIKFTIFSLKIVQQNKETLMFNNFMNYEYQPYHKIYTNQMSNFAIYLGDVSSALDMEFIKNQPIYLVITAALGMDQVSYPNGQVKHIVYPLLDAKSQNISKFFNEFFELIDKQIHSGNILVHCAAGISRSATLVISYFMKKNNWTFKQAIKFVRDKRPIILPNLGFERQLKQFQVILSRQSHTSQIQKRIVPQTSQARKYNVFSPMKQDMLPDIKNLGQTSFVRSKVLERHNINIKFEPDNLRDLANKRVQIKTRKSEHDSKAIRKKGTHFNNIHHRQMNINKELIFAKIESGRNKLLQRSNNFMNMNFIHDMSNFGEQPLTNSKKLSSLSHRSQKVSQDRKLRRNYSNNKKQKHNNLFEDINKVLVSKLHLNQRKFATQKQLRSRGLNRLAQL